MILDHIMANSPNQAASRVKIPEFDRARGRKGPRMDHSVMIGDEPPRWQDERRAPTPVCDPTSNAASGDGSAPRTIE
jgi:hypothetical protein